MFPECSIAEFVRGEKVAFLILGHVAQTVFFRRYTPGLITALLVVLPYSLYGFHRLFTANLISGDSFMTSILVGALLFVPLILVASQLGKVFAR